MTYEEFEDRHGASTTGDRRAVWDAGFEEGRRTVMAHTVGKHDCECTGCELVRRGERIAQLKEELEKYEEQYAILASAYETDVVRLEKAEKELAECREHLAAEAAKRLGKNPPEKWSPHPTLKKHE